jgi:multicomponent Na+:H+ antiporter subunit G
VSVLIDAVSVALLVVGAAFLLGGTVGLVRLPDLYTRAHAASKCDSAGAGSILLALALQGGLAFGDLKLVLLMLLVLISGPTTAHALARAGHRTGLAPWTDPERGSP